MATPKSVALTGVRLCVCSIVSDPLRSTILNEPLPRSGGALFCVCDREGYRRATLPASIILPRAYCCGRTPSAKKSSTVIIDDCPPDARFGLVPH